MSYLKLFKELEAAGANLAPVPKNNDKILVTAANNNILNNAIKTSEKLLLRLIFKPINAGAFIIQHY